LEPSSHWARPASERSGRGRCVGPNAISGFIREADSAHAARGDRSGQSGGINVLRLEYQGHKPAAHAANRLTRPHRHKPSADTATCVDHGCQSPRAFLIWEIWAKADICGPVGAAAEPRGFVGTSARLPREAPRPKYRACDSPCDRAAASCDNGKPQPDIGKRPGLPHAHATGPLQ
jgi:hypothetical protein